MPGQINEYAFDTPVTVEKALEAAGLSANGKVVKLDGVAVALDYTIPSTAKVLVLTKMVKGN